MQNSKHEYGAIHAQLRFLEGRLLTIVEAAIADQAQREAVKSLVRGEIAQTYNAFSPVGFAGGPVKGKEQSDEPRD